MRIRLLGCGTSSGVPRIGGDWGACDPTEPRNRRTRVSALVETEATRILIDTGPDMRAQLLDAGVSTVDAVIWTHDHADHCHGIDDLRQLYHNAGTAVIGYARAATLEVLVRRFGYAFDGRHGYPPSIEGRLLPDRVRIGDIGVSVVDQPHGDITSAGLRFDADGKSIVYATDFKQMTDDMAVLYQDADVLVIDALRERTHPTHPSLAEAIDHARHVRARRTVLIHMDQSMDYARLVEQLPAGIEPGHDGMVIAP